MPPPTLIVRSMRHHVSITRPLFSARQTTCLYQRYASTTAYKPLPGKIAPETKKAVAHGTKTLGPHKTPAVNPPASTLPPPLDTPVRGPGQGNIKYVYRIGKSYISFYKTALVAVWHNFQASQAVISRLPPKDLRGKELSLAIAVKAGLLTRAEYIFIVRSRSDIKKLPLIGLMLVAFGEFTPLIVIFVTGLIPRIVWIPKQVAHSRTKNAKRREESFRNGTIEDGQPLSEIAKLQGLEGLTPSQILHLSRALALHSHYWEKLWREPPQWVARHKVGVALQYLAADDYAINRDGGIEAMSDDEVIMACEERGMDVLEYDVATLRKRFESYLDLRIQKDIGVAALALVRPSQWDQLEAKQIEEGT